MSSDRYTVLGGFVEKTFGHLLIQAEFWNASHDATRDPASVLTIVKNTSLNANQRSDFFGSSASKADSTLTETDVVKSVKYNVQTFYVRLGYNVKTSVGSFIPYVFVDWMTNPEVINSKTWGGDNEAGIADNGIFTKYSLGVVYKPIDAVAIKLDGSVHSQKFNGKTESYPEIRFDVSYAFK